MDPVSEALLKWYDRNARDLPWRGIHDPYRTWVSEAMLQQTRVETVIPYYERFLARFPTLRDLASAEEEDVLRQWEGLGYYSRARNLWLGARQVMADFGGVLPSGPSALRAIRGIGPYTAGAVASIAFDVPVPAVDGNVIRVLSRLYGIREDPTLPEVRRRVEALAAALVPDERPGDHNQALMDLGASLCAPGTPDCASCPLRRFCDAFQRGDAADLPMLPPAKKPKELLYDLLIVFSPDGVLMRRRTESLLKGLWCFPMRENTPDTVLTQEAASAFLRLPLSGLAPAGTARHVFTHRIWRMRLYTAQAASCPAPKGFAWISPHAFPSLPLPTAVRAAAEIVRGEFS